LQNIFFPHFIRQTMKTSSHLSHIMTHCSRLERKTFWLQIFNYDPIYVIFGHPNFQLLTHLDASFLTIDVHLLVFVPFFIKLNEALITAISFLTTTWIVLDTFIQVILDLKVPRWHVTFTFISVLKYKLLECMDCSHCFRAKVGFKQKSTKSVGQLRLNVFLCCSSKSSKEGEVCLLQTYFSVHVEKLNNTFFILKLRRSEKNVEEAREGAGVADDNQFSNISAAAASQQYIDGHGFMKRQTNLQNIIQKIILLSITTYNNSKPFIWNDNNQDMMRPILWLFFEITFESCQLRPCVTNFFSLRPYRNDYRN